MKVKEYFLGKSNGKGWFGAGIMSEQPINLSEAGHLNFRIKIPANIAFQIGVIDAWGNQNYVEFPANQTKFGLSRDGDGVKHLYQLGF